MMRTAVPVIKANMSELLSSILDAVTAAGHDVNALDADVLTPVDHLHTFGQSATLRLAAAANVAADDVVLDVGCGIGGPARTLATRYGCQVVGVDADAEYCEVAAELNRFTGLDDLIEIRVGDAAMLPCDDDEFTVVWTEHVSMNIAAKAQLYAEMRRVLVTGGRLAFFDVLAGLPGPIHLPVTWADDPAGQSLGGAGAKGRAHNALASAEETRELLGANGFKVRLWEDVTASASDYVTSLALVPRLPGGLGRHLILPDLSERAATLARNVDEGRLTFVQCVADAI
jgi:ubiquinone/menaquinone biosynthesis C-methylase UbiE